MPKFDIAGHRRIFFLISLLMIIPGFICMGVRGFNFGIDFTGGTIIDLHFEHPVTLADIRTSLAKYDLDNSTIQLSGTESGVESSENAMIRTVDLEENQRKEVMAALTQDVGPYTVLREEKVGATIGGELITNAVLALVISWALIILYVAYRFEWRFGVSAVLALVHDIIIVLAVFSLTQRQIDSSFIAALLTIVGYSINDTIVIFDRIRENLKLHFRARRCGRARQPFHLSDAYTLALHGLHRSVHNGGAVLVRRRDDEGLRICAARRICGRMLFFDFHCEPNLD